MPNPKYDIVFEGRYVEGADPVRVRALISEIFKVGREESRRLFSGRSFVIKKGVDLPEAHRFKNLMRKAGAACRLVPQDVTLTDPTSQADRLETNGDAGGSGDGERPSGLIQPGTRPQSDKPKEKKRLVKASSWPGTTRGRSLTLLLAALALLVAASFAVPWNGSGPMPADSATLQRFVSSFNTGLLAIKAGRSRAVTQIEVAKAVVEDMGYDYDQTLLAWRFNRALTRDTRHRTIGEDYLLGPVRTQFELDPRALRTFLAPATFAAMEKVESVGAHITLQSIELLRECARGRDWVPHEALTAGLGKFNVPFDPQFPEISIEEAFYGLRFNGLVQIHKQREWKTDWVELEIVDRDEIADQERRLRWLEGMYAQYTLD